MAAPHITIVTPSFNQGKFLEATIRSVLTQDYPDREYRVIDGGSTDDSVEIIRRYENQLAFWCSQADRGQAHAINQGWQRAGGDVLAYLNSDDAYCPGALRAVAETFAAHPDAGLVYGHCHLVDERGRTIGARILPEMTLERILCWSPPLLQPAVFWSRKAIEAVGRLDESLHYTLDYDLFLRVAVRFPIRRIDSFLADIRRHRAAKTVANPMRHVEEGTLVATRFLESHPELANLRATTTASFLLRRAHVHCLEGDGRRARAALAEAVCLAPALRAKAAPVWLKSLLPLPVANALRRWR